MQIYYDLHERDPNSVEILTRLVSINLHMELMDQAIINLKKLISLDHTKSSYYDQLAHVFSKLQDFDKACETYYSLISQRPRMPEAHFNLAFYLRKAGRFEAAIESYKDALTHGIDQAEEAHLNIAVIFADDLRKEDEAKKELTEALAINRQYLPALYNLANLYEDRGDRGGTIELFEKILAIEPNHAKALSRLVALKNVKTPRDPQLVKLSDVSKSRDLPLSDKIDVFYSLGKAHDECNDYDQAFLDYTIANELNKLAVQPYDQIATENLFDRVIKRFSADWMKENIRQGEEQPIFICGMFRSGSTLVEQMLASHPLVTAGGERDSFIRELNQPKAPYPDSLDGLGKESLHKIADRYLSQSRKLFPQAQYLTDKRPDNFLYLGLIKTLFPTAKIIYTTRNPLDNCLSVYFVRLGPAMNYAVNLDHIAHYYDQQSRLLQHWQSIFEDDLYVADYDEIIRQPRVGVEGILNYLGLDWHDDCLNFHRLKNTVKTASVWQVRQPLYTTSSGRWRNYEKHIGGLIEHHHKRVEGVEHE
ncbi:sulfotransferase [Pseudomonadota bacterium]